MIFWWDQQKTYPANCIHSCVAWKLSLAKVKGFLLPPPLSIFLSLRTERKEGRNKIPRFSFQPCGLTEIPKLHGHLLSCLTLGAMLLNDATSWKSGNRQTGTKREKVQRRAMDTRRKRDEGSHWGMTSKSFSSADYFVQSRAAVVLRKVRCSKFLHFLLSF